MTGFSIGRIGLAANVGGDGLSFSHPFAWSQQGLQISLQGLHVCATDAQAVWLMNNIIGLSPAANPDETWVPVCSQTVSQICGFMRVTDAQAVIERGSLGSGGTRIVQWQVSGERALSGGGASRVEIPTVVSRMANGWSPAIDYIAVQSVPTGSFIRSFYGSSTDSEARTAENGTTDTRVLFDNSGSVSVAPTVMVYPPDDHYVASAYVKATEGVVVGRRDASIGSDTLVIGNGLVRITPTATTLDFSWWNGSSWVSATSFAVLFNSLATTINRQLILRNTPEECVLRLTCTTSVTHATFGITRGVEGTIDIGVRRGDLFLKVYTTYQDSAPHQLRFNSNTTCVTTNTTNGIRTSATVSSRYPFLTSDYATTTDTTNGRLTSGNRTKCTFAIGVGSATTGTLAGVAGLSRQTFGAWGEAQRVVVTG